MLRKDLRYVCIDFETTGLDPENDEAIQVGIVSFDHTGKTLDTFSSYIKPKKELQELKDIVRVITGLEIEQLGDAPSFHEISDEVKRFFDKNTVVIGHNIQFDLSILAQYGSFEYLTQVDTFPLAQSLMPFSPSYALEVLDKSLLLAKNDSAEKINGTTHHDALYDAYATQRVFLECIKRIEQTASKYEQIMSYLQRGKCALTEIIEIPSLPSGLTTAIPLLNKTYVSDKKLITPDTLTTDSFTDKARHFTGDRSLKEACKILPKENVIYAFSQRHKIQIAKNVLHELGLTHIETGNQHLFDAKLLGLFFRKTSFDQHELYFALKYFFHAMSEHSNIDLNSGSDRKIYHALKEREKKQGAKPVELLTHEMLYEKMRNHEIMPYTTIFFFDQDWRYDTHMKRSQKPFDLHLLLQITDSLLYRDQLLDSSKMSPRETLHTKLVIFLGIWQTEVANLLKDVSNSAVEVDNIADNTYFYKINLLLPQITELIHSLENNVSDEDREIVKEKRTIFTDLLNAPCVISTRLQGNEVHFTVKKLHSYLDYSEFEQLFDTYQTIFLSHTKKDRQPLNKHTSPFATPPVVARPGKDKLTYDEKNIYIFSNNKQTSQELLVRLHNHKPQKHKVHGENITGGKGKNIFSIKTSPYNIIIGGYDFYLQCIAQKINIDKIYTLCINGPLEHIISADLSYYGHISHT